jgi:hypothetical protein
MTACPLSGRCRPAPGAARQRRAAALPPGPAMNNPCRPVLPHTRTDTQTANPATANPQPRRPGRRHEDDMTNTPGEPRHWRPRRHRDRETARRRQGADHEGGPTAAGAMRLAAGLPASPGSPESEAWAAWALIPAGPAAWVTSSRACTSSPSPLPHALHKAGNRRPPRCKTCDLRRDPAGDNLRRVAARPHDKGHTARPRSPDGQKDPGAQPALPQARRHPGGYGATRSEHAHSPIHISKRAAPWARQPPDTAPWGGS